MSMQTRALRLYRQPGEFGPVLRCAGELSVATAEALRRELELLAPLGHRALTINLARCDLVDVDGLLTILRAFRRLQTQDRQLVIVAGTAETARLLRIVGISQVLPVFPSEALAAEALRGGGPPPPAGAEAPSQEALLRWRAIEELLERNGPEEALRYLDAVGRLCERAGELPAGEGAAPVHYCQFCPLYQGVSGGARSACRALLEPIVAALSAGDAATARACIAEVIRVLHATPPARA